MDSKRFLKGLGIAVAVLAVVVIGGLLWYGNPPDHYYRLGIEVETPDGLKPASNTFAVYQSYHSWGLPETLGLRQRLEGHAVFLDLGYGRNVVALLGHGPKGGEFSRIERLDNVAFSKTGRPIPWYATKNLFGSAPLTGGDIPTLVTFDDLKNPKTARFIRPEDFENVFGPHFRFKRAWVEIGGQKVTRGITRHLPWITHFDAYRANPHNQFTGTLPFSELNFVRS